MCKGKCCSWNGCVCSKIAWILVIVGGLNWGLVGLGMLLGGNDWNLVKMIFGSIPTLEAVVYLLVGISAVVKVVGCRCAKCKDACATCAVEDKKEEVKM